MKKVKYKCTGPMGETHDRGDVIDAYILAKDAGDDRALIFHPAKTKNECSSLEMCKYAHNKKDGSYYIPVGENYWINLSKKEEQKLIGKVEKQHNQEENEKRMQSMKKLLEKALKV